MNLDQNQEVVIKINKKTAETITEVKGVQGTSCSNSLNWVGKLGYSDTKNKPEYYQDNFQTNEVSEI